MSAVIETGGLGKRYRRRWALTDCTLSVPAGHVVGLVGPNGAGKTTLLSLAVGLLAPTAGTIEVLGGVPGAGPAQLARVGFLAQDAPVYARLSVADHLKLGARLNPAWDAGLARGRVERLDLDPGQKAGTLSGGQRAQLALTLAVAKRPELLVLDEPVASLDPLARREFLQDLMEAVAEQELSVVLSSHLVADLERVCDYLIVLVGSRVRVAGPVEELLAAHHLLTGPRRDPGTLPDGLEVISASHTDVQTTLLVRTSGPVMDPAWTISEVGLEDLVLAYMSQATGRRRGSPPPPGGAEMIWLTWRQFRVQAVTAAAALAAFAILLAATGPHLASLYAASGITGCHGGTCANAASGFLSHLAVTSAYPVVYMLGIALILLAPAIIGIFWGAPLIARELETRTFTLAWNQSITRTWWLVVKLTLTGLAAMAVTEALSLIYAWWENPVSNAIGLAGPSRTANPFIFGRFSSVIFATVGITPLGYAAFAFTLGNRHRRPHPPHRASHGHHPGHLRRRPDRHATVDPPAPDPAQPHHHNHRRREHRLRRPQRHHRPRPPRRLDPVQRSHQPGRPPDKHPPRRLRRGIHKSPRPRAVHGKPGLPGDHHLPARQPLLAPPGNRDRDLPGPHADPGRVLLLAAQPPPDLTCPARIKGAYCWRCQHSSSPQRSGWSAACLFWLPSLTRFHRVISSGRNWTICTLIRRADRSSSCAHNRRSVIVRANYNVPACHAPRPRRALSFTDFRAEGSAHPRARPDHRELTAVQRR